MVVAVYGGSFDPPHVAHVLAAQYLLSVGLADRVIVVPVFRHALSKNLSDFATRVRLCRLAFENDARVTVSEIEETLPEPSYTLYTLQTLAKELPGQRLRLVIGADVLSETDRWHRFDKIAALAPPLVLGRAGVNAPDAPPVLLPEVSSTEARSWFRSQATAADRVSRERLIPAPVRELIGELGLYRNES